MLGRGCFRDSRNDSIKVQSSETFVLMKFEFDCKGEDKLKPETAAPKCYRRPAPVPASHETDGPVTQWSVIRIRSMHALPTRLIQIRQAPWPNSGIDRLAFSGWHFAVAATRTDECQPGWIILSLASHNVLVLRLEFTSNRARFTLADFNSIDAANW